MSPITQAQFTDDDVDRINPICPEEDCQEDYRTCQHQSARLAYIREGLEDRSKMIGMWQEYKDGRRTGRFFCTFCNCLYKGFGSESGCPCEPEFERYRELERARIWAENAPKRAKFRNATHLLADGTVTKGFPVDVNSFIGNTMPGVGDICQPGETVERQSDSPGVHFSVSALTHTRLGKWPEYTEKLGTGYNNQLHDYIITEFWKGTTVKEPVKWSEPMQFFYMRLEDGVYTLYFDHEGFDKHLKEETPVPVRRTDSVCMECAL